MAPPPALPHDWTADRYRLEAVVRPESLGIHYWSARDAETDSWVMVKALRRSEKTDLHLQSFRTEGEFVARLHHPNILSLLDTGDSGDWVYHVYELARMRSLRDRLAEGPPGLPLTLTVAQQLADMLAYLHGQGLVHGFCHPGNILVGPNEQVKVMGFNYGGGSRGSSSCPATRRRSRSSAPTSRPSPTCTRSAASCGR